MRCSAPGPGTTLYSESFEKNHLAGILGMLKYWLRDPTYCRFHFLLSCFLTFLWLIEIEINMLDEKLIKFLALQRIHQLFPPGSKLHRAVSAHPLASGGHHTEGAHAHSTPLGPPSACEQSHLPSMENLSPPCRPLLGLINA